MSYEFADGYQIRNQGATHYLTFSIEGWVDLFSRKIYKDLILESFAHCQKNKNLCIHAFVIMTNHVHTIWTAKDNNLSDVIRDFKTFTSKSFIKIRKTNYRTGERKVFRNDRRKNFKSGSERIIERLQS